MGDSASLACTLQKHETAAEAAKSVEVAQKSLQKFVRDTKYMGDQTAENKSTAADVHRTQKQSFKN